MSDMNEIKGNPDAAPSTATTRSERMLHEASFVTSSIMTSSRNRKFKRPPGYAASSLDYQPGVDGNDRITSSKNIRPINKKNDRNGLEKEQANSEGEHQNRRRNPTRAQGNYGPPSQVESFKDIDNLTDEQLYKLLMDDPKFYESFMAAAGDKKKRIASGGEKQPKTSPPTGSRRARANNSSSRKPTNSPFKRSSRNIGRTEKEVPYFQWLFLFVMIGIALYQIRKSMAPHVKAEKNGKGQHGQKGRSAKQKNRKSQTKTTIKMVGEKEFVKFNDNGKSNPIVTEQSNGGSSASKKLISNNASLLSTHSPSRKKKKLKKKSKVPTSSLSEDRKGENQSEAEPNLKEKNCEAADEVFDHGVQSKLASEKDVTAIDDLVGEKEPAVAETSKREASDTYANISDEFGWETVDKTKKKVSAAKKAETKNTEPSEAKVNGTSSVREISTNIKTIKHRQPLADSSSMQAICSKSSVDSQAAEKVDAFSTNLDIPLDVGKENICSALSALSPTQAMIKNKNDNATKIESEVPAISSNDAILKDAAFALQLHEEELNLARSSANEIKHNAQEEVWEMVTKKKKSN